ncbi:MAG: hypothetical protein IH827_04455, partial [Myxococcales bacterium]|nr:hypothetical protein [Myxococcales bacterium]
MKFTLAWLKDHLDTDASLARIVATLTAIGLEVDAVEDRAADLAQFRVARVISAEPHPDADRLRGTIVVRPAREGERLQTLDGEDRELSADTLLITDDRGPITLAGVMGGADS